MGEGFVKLYASILDSSVWDLDHETRIVWITLLAMASPKGIVHAAIPGIARRANVTIEAAQKAMKILEAPDPYSRSTAFEGRRVGRDGRDWIILNFDEHRRRQAEDDERERKRIWWENNRGKNAKKSSKLANTSGTLAETSPSEADTEADTDTNTEKEKKKKRAPARKAPKKNEPSEAFESWYGHYPKKVNKPAAWKKWQKVVRPPLEEMLSILETQKQSYDWTQEGGKYVPNPSTYLNNEGWNNVYQAEAPKPQHKQTQHERNVAILKAQREKREAEAEKRPPVMVDGKVEVVR
jgi:hypothetical protein